MTDIKIQNGGGITQSIKIKLQQQGYDTSNINKSIWAKVMEEVKAENEQRVKDGKAQLYRGGSDISGSGHSNFVVEEGATLEVSEGAWTKICRLFGVSSSQRTENAPSVQALQPTQAQSPSPKLEQVKTNVAQAQKILNDNFKNFSHEDLQKLGITEAKRDRLLGYINNISYDNDQFGAAKADGSKGIIVSEGCQNTDNMANMVKLLIHEANHCDEAYLCEHPEESEPTDRRHRDASGNPLPAGTHLPDSKEEERACETLGLLTSATFINKGYVDNKRPGTPPTKEQLSQKMQRQVTDEEYNNFIKNGDYYGIYGEPPTRVTDYLNNPDKLKKDLDDWLASGYTNLPDDTKGNLTLERMKISNTQGLIANSGNETLQIKAGDIVRINWRDYTIGSKGIILSGTGRSPVCQLSDYTRFSDGSPYNICSKMVFDGFGATDEEKASAQLSSSEENDITAQNFQIIRDGKQLYTGKIYGTLNQ